MKILILPLLLLFLPGCLPFRDSAGAYSSVSVRDEQVIAAAEFAIAAQQGVINAQADSTPVQLTLLKLV